MAPARDKRASAPEMVRRSKMNSIRVSALIASAALAATPALAQGYGSAGGMQSQQSTPMRMQSTQGMQGLHEMPATVTSINKSSGMVSVKSEGMSLRLHFPPSALSNIKAGDKIKVQMGLMKT
jgi:hypothetical protein